MHDRVVAPRLEIVESRLGVIDVSAVSERISCTDRVLAERRARAVGHRDELAPRIVTVLRYHLPRRVHDPDHVATAVPCRVGRKSDPAFFSAYLQMITEHYVTANSSNQRLISHHSLPPIVRSLQIKLCCITVIQYARNSIDFVIPQHLSGTFLKPF